MAEEKKVTNPLAPFYITLKTRDKLVRLLLRLSGHLEKKITADMLISYFVDRTSVEDISKELEKYLRGYEIRKPGIKPGTKKS